MKKQWLWIVAAAAACIFVLWYAKRRKETAQADAKPFEIAQMPANNPANEGAIY